MPLTAAILIATGLTRSGDEPIALLPWANEQTLIEMQIDALQSAGVQVIEIVLGDQAERIIPLVSMDNVEPIVNPRWRDGIAASLRVGASAVPRETATAIITDIAEPRTAFIYQQLLQSHSRTSALITRPTFEASPGTPIVVDRAMLAELRNLALGDDLNTLIARHAPVVSELPVTTDAVLLRIETAAALEASRKRLQ